MTDTTITQSTNIHDHAGHRLGCVAVEKIEYRVRIEEDDTSSDMPYIYKEDEVLELDVVQWFCRTCSTGAVPLTLDPPDEYEWNT